MLSPFYAAGLMLIPLLTEAALCSLLPIPQLILLLELMLNGSAATGCVRQLPVPPAFVARSYGAFFEVALELGASRAPFRHSPLMPHRSSLTIHRSSLTIRHSSLTIHHSSRTTHHSLPSLHQRTSPLHS